MKQVPVVYFFQNEPKAQYMFFYKGDDLQQLTVKNVLQQFPFRITCHHVRFKIFVQDVDPKTHAWFDISNPNAKVPIVNDTVFVKLLLLSDVTYSRIAKKMVECLLQTSSPIGDLQIQKGSAQQQSPQPPNKEISNQQQQQQQNPQPFQQQKQTQQQLQPPQAQEQQQSYKPAPERKSNKQLSNQSNTSQSGDILESFEKLDFKPFPQHSQSQPISQADLDQKTQSNQAFQNFPQFQQTSINNQNNDGLLNFDNTNNQVDSQIIFQFSPDSKQQPQQTVKKDESLFEFDAPQKTVNAPVNNTNNIKPAQEIVGKKDNNNDLFDFDGPSNDELNAQKNNNQYEGLTDKQFVEMRVQQAAAELQQIWQDENDYNVQRQSAKDEVEPKILKWGYKNNIRNNLRLLLTTLNDVLWDGAEWQCSIGDLMTDGKVKLKYRQALLIVHPDKQNQAPPTQRYIAERVFYELNQAWNDEKNRN